MDVPMTSADPLTSGAAPSALGPRASIVPQSQQLSRNPMLPQHPLGAYTDAQYEAQVASLRSNIAKQYADVLQQLGYVDENGNFVQGSVETNANRQKGDLRRSAGLATEDVTRQHQQLGTLFSGLRGTDQARAEYPFVNQIADIETQTPLSLSQLYEKAGGLVGDFTNQQNQLLADAASRRAADLMTTGPGGGGPPAPVEPTLPVDGSPAPTEPPPVDTGAGYPLPPDAATTYFPQAITPGINMGEAYPGGVAPSATPPPLPAPAYPVPPEAATTYFPQAITPGLNMAEPISPMAPAPTPTPPAVDTAAVAAAAAQRRQLNQGMFL